jgi:hypothetical protein
MKRKSAVAIAAAIFALANSAAFGQVASRYQSSSAAEASHVICAGSCALTSLQVNSGASAVWVMAFDATSAPADGTVAPIKWWQLATATTLNVAWPNPVKLNSGLVLVCSTTGPFSKTASSTCEFSADIQ